MGKEEDDKPEKSEEIQRRTEALDELLTHETSGQVDDTVELDPYWREAAVAAETQLPSPPSSDETDIEADTSPQFTEDDKAKTRIAKEVTRLSSRLQSDSSADDIVEARLNANEDSVSASVELSSYWRKREEQGEGVVTQQPHSSDEKIARRLAVDNDVVITDHAKEVTQSSSSLQNDEDSSELERQTRVDDHEIEEQARLTANEANATFNGELSSYWRSRERQEEVVETQQSLPSDEEPDSQHQITNDDLIKTDHVFEITHLSSNLQNENDSSSEMEFDPEREPNVEGQRSSDEAANSMHSNEELTPYWQLPVGRRHGVLRLGTHYSDESTSSSSEEDVQVREQEPFEGQLVENNIGPEERQNLIRLIQDRLSIHSIVIVDEEMRIKRMVRGGLCLGFLLICGLIVGLVFAARSTTNGGPSPPTEPSITSPTPAPVLLAPVAAPVIAPVGPTSLPVKCFETTEELFDAVDAYVANNTKQTIVGQTYGWPIASWCVSKLSNFSDVFSAERNPDMATFEEDISDWDMSGALYLFQMFRGAALFDQDLFWDTSNVIFMAYMVCIFFRFYCSVLFFSSTLTHTIFSQSSATLLPTTQT